MEPLVAQLHDVFAALAQHQDVMVQLIVQGTQDEAFAVMRLSPSLSGHGPAISLLGALVGQNPPVGDGEASDVELVPVACAMLAALRADDLPIILGGDFRTGLMFVRRCGRVHDARRFVDAVYTRFEHAGNLALQQLGVNVKHVGPARPTGGV